MLPYYSRRSRYLPKIFGIRKRITPDSKRKSCLGKGAPETHRDRPRNNLVRGRGRNPLVTKGTDETRLAVITASELQMGVHRATDGRVQERRRNYVEAILERFETVPIDLNVARTYGYAMVTANTREFRRVEGVEVIGLAR